MKPCRTCGKPTASSECWDHPFDPDSRIADLESKLAEREANAAKLLRLDWEALPQRVKDYIAAIETNADPGGTVQDLFAARENVAGLTLKLAAAQADTARLKARIVLALEAIDYCTSCVRTWLVGELDEEQEQRVREALDAAKGE